MSAGAPIGSQSFCNAQKQCIMRSICLSRGILMSYLMQLISLCEVSWLSRSSKGIQGMARSVCWGGVAIEPLRPR
jgi:hypothetical protein